MAIITERANAQLARQRQDADPAQAPFAEEKDQHRMLYLFLIERPWKRYTSTLRTGT